jgi:hypothetical protein
MRTVVSILAAIILAACQTGTSQPLLSTPTGGPVEVVVTTALPAATPTPPPASTAVPTPIPTPTARPDITELLDPLFQSVPRTIDAVYVQDEYAYLNVGPILVILDISDRQAPHPLGAVKLPVETISNIYVVDSYAYVAANESGLRIVDVSNPAQPLEVGVYSPPLVGSIEKPYIWSGPEPPAYLYRQGARAVVVGQTSGQVYAYVAALGAGLRVVNVSDPTKPVEVGALDTGGGVVDVAIAGGQAYLANPAIGLQVVDISEPTRLQAADSVRPTVLLSPPLPIWNIALPTDQADTSYVYSAAGTCVSFEPGLCPGMLYVTDVANPAAPQTFSLKESPHLSTNIAVSHQHAYLLTMYGLQVLDVSNPAHPQTETFYPSYSSKDISVAGDTLYLAALDGGLQILDLSDPAAPALVSQWQPTLEPAQEPAAEPTEEPTAAPTGQG